ncbi:PLP-dependent aminotransferase family protein [Parathalassolituus penaei]|uniref:PLP-dependent aminotransferase family protein n=1 Tax=Parathalassolituus penaei TaxID=2997323 RepID=A0A9X3EG54_9GAMM|nr:PLP-dependent aminotransferase family protein [Parathalassolituus penaei]MCY0966615.1 PLP-dependent aminotransferase family protein [Parathalassolituus penaei]
MTKYSPIPAPTQSPSTADQEFRYQQLEQQLLAGIQQQRWRLGERLPSIRDLCQQFEASKATVQHALQRLEAQGLLEARPKSGFYVTLRPGAISPPQARNRLEPPQPVNVSQLLLDIMRRSAAFDILPGRPSGDLPPGIVALNRSIGRALRRQRGDDYLYYDDPAGLPALREQLCLHLSRRGCQLPVDQLAITSGCQHALFLALMACCKAGDVVAVESPGFYGLLQLLEQLQLQVIEIPSPTSTGMDPDALEAALARWPIRACIVSPAFSTPGGALMPDAHRQRLLTLAEQHDMAMIEDDIYADTAFATPPDPLKALDQHGRVILCSSFSKSLSRDLRLGWISGGRWHARILHLKLVTQLASSRSLQQGVADFLEDGSFSSHLRRQKYLLREQRDRLLAALRIWPGNHRISTPEGGLAVWLELDQDADTLTLYPQALQAGVVITPGPLFSASGQFHHCLRLSFAHDWTPSRLQALQTLSGLLVP